MSRKQCTQVDNVALELGLELHCINLECPNVFGVAATLDVNGDLGSPIDPADIAAGNIAPLVVGVIVEGLEYDDILLHFEQRLPLSLHGRLVLRRLLQVLASRLRIQLNNLPSQNLSISSVATDAGLDLVESVLESMESGKSNMLGRCARALEFVIDGGILAENMAVANTKDLGAGGAALVLVLMEEQRNATLSISGLHLCGSDGHSERSSEEAVDIVGRVGVVGDAQKVWTRQLLHGSLVPFDHRAPDSIGFEKSEDAKGSVVCILSGGGSGMCRNPNHDGTDSVLPVLAMGDETSCLDGRVANLPSFQELADLGSDRVPDSVEWCVEDSIDGLGRENEGVCPWGCGWDCRGDPSGRGGPDGPERYCGSTWFSPSPR